MAMKEWPFIPCCIHMICLLWKTDLWSEGVFSWENHFKWSSPPLASVWRCPQLCGYVSKCKVVTSSTWGVVLGAMLPVSRQQAKLQHACAHLLLRFNNISFKHFYPIRNEKYAHTNIIKETFLTKLINYCKPGKKFAVLFFGELAPKRHFASVIFWRYGPCPLFPFRE